MMEAHMPIIIFEDKPIDFSPQIEVSACYIVKDEKILLLQQGLNKVDPECWGVPAGKIERGETPDKAALRELFEETGICIENSSQVDPLGCVYIRKPALDYIFHLFRVDLKTTPPVTISQEHLAYEWIPFQNLAQKALMLGAKECIEIFQRRIKNQTLKK